MKILINSINCSEKNDKLLNKYNFILNDNSSKIIIKNKNTIYIKIETNAIVSLKNNEKKILIDKEEKIIKLISGKTIIDVVKFLFEKNKIQITIDNDYISKTLINYPYLFHKYLLKISEPSKSINYIQIDNSNINININRVKKYYLHIHCFDLAKLEEYFDKMINIYVDLFGIIVTYSVGTINNKYNNLVWLKIPNKGADIGGKLCAINYLRENNYEYEFVLFIHSKTDLVDRVNFLKPFESIARAELIIDLMKNSNPKLDVIFPNYHNIIYSDKINTHTIKHNQRYLNDFLSWIGINYNPHKINWFNGTNTFVFSKKIIDFIFGGEKLLIMYNILNESNTFDFEWYRKKYNIKEKDIQYVYNHFKTNNNNFSHFGNHFADESKSLPNCCIEHMFERAWVNIIHYLELNYLCLPGENIFDYYKIKLNAIFFPQFHNSHENNKFWGEGFTEWTLLKPFPDKITVRNNQIDILKPHPDIGYYSLDDINTFKKQCLMAKTFGLNGFVIYHYWFGNSHSVLNKVEEHLLTGEIKIDFEFCFSWANEPWTKRWDGFDNDILIEQNYEDVDDFTHIEYLTKFFLMSNYMKNSQGECLFYIYNFSHIKEHFEQIKLKWNKYLSQYNLTVQFISTFNALKSNKKYGTDVRFDFLPMSATDTWVSYLNSPVKFDNKVHMTKQHFEIDYTNLIDKFNSSRYDDVTKYHFGIPLNWNNIVRRNTLSHLHINNFSQTNLKKMFIRVISKIIIKYINLFESKKINKYNIEKINFEETNYNLDNNVIIINAWNEWNEQAILEPTNIDGYLILETICKIIKI